MIEIVIKKTVTTTYTEPVNLVIEETPTDKIEIKESNQSYEPKVTKTPVMERKYQVQDVNRSKETTYTLLHQQIKDDNVFSLERVIAAINNMPAPGAVKS